MPTSFFEVGIFFCFSRNTAAPTLPSTTKRIKGSPKHLGVLPTKTLAVETITTLNFIPLLLKVYSL